MTENKVRKEIRTLIKEAYTLVREAQVGKKINSHINNLLDQAELDVVGGIPYNPTFVIDETRKSLGFKLNKIMQRNFDYTNFYIVKLGNFIVQDNDKSYQLAFNIPGFDKNVSFPYVYIYQDKVIVLKFGSRFYDTDELLMEGAEKIIKDFKINLQTLSESGKIIMLDEFDTDNVIDLVDYSKVTRPETTPKEKEIKPLKLKSDYRAGTPYKHEKFGKGKIVSSKKIQTDEDGSTWYNVVVDFENDKQRTLRLKSIKKQPSLTDI